METLSLVTVGPGMGESIIVVVPPNHVLVVDSLLHRGSCPTLEFLESKGLEVSVVVLTHPHKDHAEGFDLLIHACKGPVGCGKFFLEGQSLADPQQSHLAGKTVQALAAVKSRWESNPTTEWKLETGSRIGLGDSVLTALHPDPSEVGNLKRANDWSTPILLEWKSTRLLLGAEVPKRFWADIDVTFQTARHHGYKVAHHCSKSNFEPSVFQGATDRFWVATPCAQKPQPPRFEDGRGVDQLLGCVSEVYLTSVLFEVPDRESGAVGRNWLHELASALKTKSSFGGVTLIPQIEPREPQDAFVLASWDENGNLTQLARGEQSVVVVQG